MDKCRAIISIILSTSGDYKQCSVVLFAILFFNIFKDNSEPISAFFGVLSRREVCI